ncbi:hypothetical protein WH50_24750 [Pokkaliibacter plantistimulans]|uniref:Phage tail collar domain-containing protein n=1 Tax=Pokkaliibacter plantistimulans TaxID=1635171 RepID=A0ABX5LQ69_9GAMM|nr:tail fiber protein [Pokkaliibacter plantistimulans]PXF28722.1 hypothetical protein WH50_24750 [Pokkaliibacter plantistimulans]
MSDAFLGEIRMFSFPFAPTSWAKCDGATMQVAQNQALFSLLGNSYGGDLKTYFNLPDLRGRTPMGNTDPNAATTPGGAEAVTLTVAQIPLHNHDVQVTTETGTDAAAKDTFYAGVPQGVGPSPANLYGQASSNLVKIQPSLTSTGGGQAHNNMQPFLVTNFCICISGIYPPRPW